ncbi:hypothetical protein GCM10022286_00380 [Gryllotalpicola daejeonensis]|uniref:Uncharacterized protein n=1 Tax=Gryllotalpicola daejeonensis TaxID=993087 RepID=A0ABP7ZCQ4_9MICO
MTDDLERLLATLDPDANELRPGLTDFYVELASGETIVGDTPDELVEILVARDLLPIRRFSRTWSDDARRLALRAVWTDRLVVELRRRAYRRWHGQNSLPRRREILAAMPAGIRAIVRGKHPRAWIAPSVPWLPEWPLAVATAECWERFDDRFDEVMSRAGFPVARLHSATASQFLTSVRLAFGTVVEHGVLIDGVRTAIK